MRAGSHRVKGRVHDLRQMTLILSTNKRSNEPWDGRSPLALRVRYLLLDYSGYRKEKASDEIELSEIRAQKGCDSIRRLPIVLAQY